MRRTAERDPHRSWGDRRTSALGAPAARDARPEFPRRPDGRPPQPRGRAGLALAGLAIAAALGTAVGVLTVGFPSPSGVAPGPAAPGAKQLTIWLTGYSWQDNTPPGSSKVGEPVLHSVASGTGTFADPITVATPGHKGRQEWRPGTKFYLPTVQRYVIVEDSGAADAPKGTDTHLDMWSAGQDGTKRDVDACMDKFTGRVPAQLNPPDGLPVMAGPIYAGKRCNIPSQPDNLGTYQNPGGGGSGHRRHHSDDGDDNGDGGRGGKGGDHGGGPPDN